MCPTRSRFLAILALAAALPAVGQGVDESRRGAAVGVELRGEAALPHEAPLDRLVVLTTLPASEVCRKLKADPKTREIPIIMVTALNELGDIERGVECGTDDFVSKPVNRLELVTRVKSLLRVSHLKGELDRTLAYLNDVETREKAT